MIWGICATFVRIYTEILGAAATVFLMPEVAMSLSNNGKLDALIG
jgi:hypothetical protein